MLRRYAINVSASRLYPKDTLHGGVMCTSADAARNYIGLWMPGFRLVGIRYSCVKTTKSDGCHSLYVADAYNDATRESKLLYVREIESIE